MKKAILGSLAVLPLAAAGIFANAGAANAGALVGEFQFSGGATGATINKTDGIFNKGIDFQPSPGEIDVLFPTDSFAPLFAAEGNQAFIYDILSVPQDPANVNPFMDLGLLDGKNIFKLEKVGDYQVGQSGANVAIDVALFGKFISETGEISNGFGNLTFQVNNALEADIQDKLDMGQTFNVGFSGAAFTATDIPEPATILGLGVVAGSLALSRAGKKNKA